MVLTSFRRTGLSDFCGSALDRGDPERILFVEILIDGSFHTVLRADEQEVRRAGMPPLERCGFSLSLPEPLAAQAVMIEARLANTGEPVGAPIRLDQDTIGSANGTVRGEAKWVGALHVEGSVVSAEPITLSVLVDGVLVDTVQPTVWRHVAIGVDHAVPAKGFTCHLPDRFADGSVHRCAVLTADGHDLPGSPFAILAFADTMRGLLVGRGASERDLMRAAMFDRLVPISVPFADYARWHAERLPVTSAPNGLRFAIILVGPGAAEVTVTSLQAQTHKDWTAIALPAQSDPAGFSAASLTAILERDAFACPFVLFTLAGSTLHPFALAKVAEAFASDPQAAAVYPDIDLQMEDGSIWPLAFTAFDRERLLEQGYCAHVFAMRRSVALGALASGANTLYRMMTALLENDGGAQTIVHLPGALATLAGFDRRAASISLATSSIAYLARHGIQATAATTVSTVLPAVRITRARASAHTTIMIPTRNRRDLLERCIGSITPAARRLDADVMVLDNDSADPETRLYLRDLRTSGIAVVPVPGPFNFARMNNIGAEAARGAFLCLLNNDVTAQDSDWLETLIGGMAEADVGAIGPLLLWPSRVIQHGGLVLGPQFEVAHAFNDRLAGDPGYGDLLRVTHECSAVTAACLVTRRADYLEVGGMDEQHFPINFNDVDYCLKLRAAGRRIVFTPHAALIHAESASRGTAWTTDRQRLFERERRHLRLKWGPTLADDPYYSPVLALTPNPFSALAGPGRCMGPRRNARPVPLAVPDGL